MRIISDSHDYYDSAMAQGTDRSLVYLRKTVTTPGADDRIGIDLDGLPRLDHYHDPQTRRPSYADAYALHVLLFCGTYQPFVERTQRPRGFGPGEAVTRFWDVASLEAAIAEAARPVQAIYGHSLDWKHDFNRKTVRDAFAHRPDPAALAEIHTGYASPVILYRNVYRSIHCPDVETVLNPSLKDLGFQSQRDPFAAFQEIAQYLGGVMRRPERDTVAISDADRAAKHGLDRWSFRKKVR